MRAYSGAGGQQFSRLVDRIPEQQVGSYHAPVVVRNVIPHSAPAQLCYCIKKEKFRVSCNNVIFIYKHLFSSSRKKPCVPNGALEWNELKKNVKWIWHSKNNN